MKNFFTALIVSLVISLIVSAGFYHSSSKPLGGTVENYPSWFTNGIKLGSLGSVLNPNNTNTTAFSFGTQPVTVGALNSTVNCNSSASPAVCAAAPNGSVVIAAAATTVVVNTTAVTANSQIDVTHDTSLGTRLGVTCNTSDNSSGYLVTARTAGTSFTITATAAPTTNPDCLSFTIVN
jgi:hypothetical protein